MFYAATGHGKTHLLRGIQSEYRRRRPRETAVYLTAEQFTTSFIEALRGSGQLYVATRVEMGLQLRRPDGASQLASITIADSGPGVSPEAEAQLFAPFFSTKARGSGLGLAVCHRIVSEHSGTIAYEPRPGGGALFRVTLPLSSTHEHVDD